MECHNMKCLRENLEEKLGLPQDAVVWLLMLHETTQFFDDIADGDPTTRQDLDKTIWNVLVGMCGNMFFLENIRTLLPLVANMILKWKASDTAERNNQADERSFMWRGGYFDVVLMAIQICHGTDIAMEHADKVMSMSGESFKDYIKEFNNNG